MVYPPLEQQKALAKVNQGFTQHIKEHLPNYDLRYAIKPGISGWAQVNYPYGASIEDAKLKLSYDLYYIKNFSILLDFMIFFKTLRLVLNGKGASPINSKS